MALTNAQVTVTTSPTLLVSATDDREALISAGNAVFLGDASVSSSNGFILLALNATNNAVRIKLNAGDDLYAVTPSGTATVYVLVNDH